MRGRASARSTRRNPPPTSSPISCQIYLNDIPADDATSTPSTGALPASARSGHPARSSVLLADDPVEKKQGLPGGHESEPSDKCRRSTGATLGVVGHRPRRAVPEGVGRRPTLRLGLSGVPDELVGEVGEAASTSGLLVDASTILCRRGDLYLNPTRFSPSGVRSGRVKPGKSGQFPGPTPLPPYPPQSGGWSPNFFDIGRRAGRRRSVPQAAAQDRPWSP
jgi:hypothetical protein